MEGFVHWKRVIELGAACRVAGFGENLCYECMALLGCGVVSTYEVEVLPLLIQNVKQSIGSITAAELSWGNKDHIRRLIHHLTTLLALML
ncbi:hypothetical protein L2E82_51403 [Cichorium intybus]|nr:hypothetical protein L2E82_51403 [Cichorium intybus]